MGVEWQDCTGDSGIDSGAKQVVRASQKLGSAELANERQKTPGGSQSLQSECKPRSARSISKSISDGFGALITLHYLFCISNKDWTLIVAGLWSHVGIFPTMIHDIIT